LINYFVFDTAGKTNAEFLIYAWKFCCFVQFKTGCFSGGWGSLGAIAKFSICKIGIKGPATFSATQSSSDLRAF
jgi:hypothetical protein